MTQLSTPSVAVATSNLPGCILILGAIQIMGTGRALGIARELAGPLDMGFDRAHLQGELLAIAMSSENGLLILRRTSAW